MPNQVREVMSTETGTENSSFDTTRILVALQTVFRAR